MDILHIATEAAPFAKVGGLADVVTALALEVAKMGHNVEILLPKYDSLDYSLLKDLTQEPDPFLVGENEQNYQNRIWTCRYKGVKILLLEVDHPLAYFSRKTIYGCQDDNDRFLYFCKAALTYLTKRKKQLDLLHLHDWPAAAIPILYKESFHNLGLQIKKTVFTIHNVDYQGRCSLLNLHKIGIKKESCIKELFDPIFPGVMNLLKGAIHYADVLTTVSPTYEKEIKTEVGGRGLHQVLIENGAKLHGILNGIDRDYWNPENDPFLAAHFSVSDPPQKIREAKRKNRQALCKHLHLSESKAPLIVSITRLVPQKGPELIRHGILHTLEKGGQFALLGSSPTAEIAASFEELQKREEKNRNLSLTFKYHEELSHLLYAAADMILIPSIFEPCGLTQMLAMRYGTIPLARRTGGLADTVFDIDTSKEPEARRNGYTFDYPDQKGVDWVLDRALECYRNDPIKWEKIMKQGLKADYSWAKSALEYLKLYSSVN